MRRLSFQCCLDKMPSLEDADKLRTEILRKPGIADVKVVDRDSALADFVERDRT